MKMAVQCRVRVDRVSGWTNEVVAFKVEANKQRDESDGGGDVIRKVEADSR